MSDIVKSTTDISEQGFEVFKRGEHVPFFIGVGTVLYKSDSHYFRIYRVLKLELVKNKDYEFKRIVCLDLLSGEEDSLSFSDAENYYSVVNDLDFEKVKELSEQVYKGTISVEELDLTKSNEEAETTALTVKKSKTYYVDMLESQRRYKAEISLINALVRDKVKALENQLMVIKNALDKTVKKLNDIIFTLSLYGGIEEEVKQIREGNYASPDTAIYLQQDMLFMDEEVGDPENGGVSYDSVDKFYSWLNKFNHHLNCYNFSLVLPYEKCVTIMRVRRKKTQTDYSSDPWGNVYRAEQEMKTCMLIRNGQNIWVIHSLMEFQTKLFPDAEELQKIVDSKNEESMMRYRNGIVLIQGLFDRTDLLAPVGTVNILNADSINDGTIIYNYSKKLLENQKDKKFFKWILNDKKPLVEGMRILFGGFNNYDKKDRFTKWYASEYNAPRYPDAGIYTIELYEKRPTFLYLPDDEIYDLNTYTYRKRKKKERVYVRNYDSIVNFDEFSHRDLEYVNGILYDRQHREHYLWLVPLLGYIKKYKNEEYEFEKPFAQMIMSKFPQLSETTILDYIFYWKTKNKWKRSLKSDDAKAYRMIVSKIKRDLKNNDVLILTPSFDDDKQDGQ